MISVVCAQALEKEAKRRNDRAKVARGEALEDETSKPYGEKDKGLQGGIIIPLAPFGIPKYDQGERFDLKVCPSLAFENLPRSCKAILHIA
jgi:hypothetical protein